MHNNNTARARRKTALPCGGPARQCPAAVRSKVGPPAMSGNALFRGPGAGLPGGGPELTIQGIPTQGAIDGVTRITLRVTN